MVSQHFMEPEDSIPNSQELSTCSYPEPDQSSTHHPSPPLQRSILILSTHLRLGLPSGLLPSGFPTNNLHAFLLSPIRTTRPAHLSLLDLIILIILVLGEEYKSNQNTEIRVRIWFYGIAVYMILKGLTPHFYVQPVSLRHSCFRVIDKMTDTPLAGKQHTSPLPLLEYKTSIHAISFTQ
jgi:hypothetical protein